MNQDTFYSWVVRILKQLRIPFVDPCDLTYTGDCICGGANIAAFSQEFTMNGTSQVIALVIAPTHPNTVALFIGGQRLPNSLFTVAGTNVTVTGYTFNNGDQVQITYLNL